MANFDYEELKRALKLIRSVCDDVGNDCRICPFGEDTGECHITGTIPNEWCIKEEKPDVVRVMM